MDYATGDWLFQIDADEELIQGDGPTLKEAIKACDDVDAILITLESRWENGLQSLHNTVRIFKNLPSIHYEGRVHEKMIVDGETGFLDADILHFPFDSIAEFIDRQDRYTDLQAQDIIDSGEDVSYRNIRYNLTLKPLKLLKKMFLKKKGYKEGIYGFIFAALFSFVHFLKWAKVWERVRQK